MNIGEAAKQSGVSAKMIRKYEDMKLINPINRNESGYRKYSENDVHTFRFIKSCRNLGFSTKEIKDLLGLWKNKKRSSAKVKKIADTHIENLENKISELNSILSTLKNLTDHCHGDERPDCPIIDSLESL